MTEAVSQPSGYRLVTSQAEFDEICAHFSTLDAIALDTEFVRTRTLLPQLGLLQIFDGQNTYLIDPLAIDDLSAFSAVLANQNVVKVLHACSEDLEVFLAHLQVAPVPVFDTQFAANLLGMGASLGYARLVELQCGIALDKGESRTDWLARPLTDKQLQYAANDVVYLYQIYRQFETQITDKQRDIVYQEIAVLVDKKAATMPAEYAYLLFSNAWKLNEQQRYVLKQLAQWRLNLARERDSAINFIVKEQHLLAVAMHLPRSKTQLSAMGILLPQEIRKQGDTLIGIVNQATHEFANQESQCQVPKVRRLNDVADYKKQLAQLKSLCAAISHREGIAVEILASKKQLNQLLKWWWFEYDETALQGLMPDLLSGWRKPLFCDALLDQLGDPIRELK